MQLQFFTARKFQIPAKKIIKVIKGGDTTSRPGYVIVGNRNVIDMEKGEALKMLKNYSKEVEGYGPDAVTKKVVKSKSAKPGNGQAPTHTLDGK